MSTVTTTSDDSPCPLVARPDLAEAAMFHLSFAIGCMLAGAAFLALAQPPGVGWRTAIEAREVRPVVSRAAFEEWAERLLIARSSVRV